MHTELLDVVNKDDVIINSKSRNEVHQIGLLHREIHIWLFDKDKNLLELNDANIDSVAETAEFFLEGSFVTSDYNKIRGNLKVRGYDVLTVNGIKVRPLWLGQLPARYKIRLPYYGYFETYGSHPDIAKIQKMQDFSRQRISEL